MKEAMNIVLGMFNTSLEMNKQPLHRQDEQQEEEEQMDQGSSHGTRPGKL